MTGLWINIMTGLSRTSILYSLQIIKAPTIQFPAGNYVLKANKRNTKTKCEICSKLTIKIPGRCHRKLHAQESRTFTRVHSTFLVFIFMSVIFLMFSSFHNRFLNGFFISYNLFRMHFEVCLSLSVFHHFDFLQF